MILPVLDTYIQRHEHYLEQLLKNMVIPAENIRSAMNYSLFPGGKRIRPILVYLTCHLIEVDLNIADAIAAAIELTHCYSLIHDDLPAMDNDDLRRGKASCHRAYDEATAILVGDGMQALAIETLLTQLNGLLDNTQVISIVLELVKASGVSGMVSGQSLDLSELAKSSVSGDQLITIHRLKTGQLIRACFEMVLAAKGSMDTKHVTALRAYAQHIGLVFQIQDDYLDYYAPASTLGKGRSSDLANQKTTFATLLNKQQLETEITTHYRVALDSLQLFGPKAGAFIKLTQKLQSRSDFG